MNTIALETSVQPGSLALLRDEEVVSSTFFPLGQRTTQSFAVQLKASMTDADWRARDVGLFVVCRGPGSFTGLRIGVTAAKTFAYASGCHLLGMDTLEVVASRLPPGEDVWVVMDAQRGQLYVASFRVDAKPPVRTSATRIVDASQLIESLPPGHRISGPGLKAILDRIPSHVSVVDSELWTPTAESLGALGIARYASGERDDLWQLTPDYHRPSAAEEKLRR